MAQSTQLTHLRLRRASRFAGLAGWLVALVGLALAVLAGSAGAALLVSLFAAAWLAASVALDRLSRRQMSHLRMRSAVRPTRWGLLFLLMSLGFAGWAVHTGINLFCLTASFLLGAVLCCAILALLALRRLHIHWTLPEHIHAGSVFPMQVRVRNDRAFLPIFALNVASAAPDGPAGHGVVRLPAGREVCRALRLTLPQRGLQPMPSVRASSVFPLGLLESSLRVKSRQKILVLPGLGSIHREAFLRRAEGDATWQTVLQRRRPEGETRSLRQYRPGDDPRHIHWPTTARMGELHVREFDQQRGERVLLVLDAFLPEAGRRERDGRRKRFEKAVSFVATMARMLAERNVLFAFASYCPELVSLPFRASRAHSYDVMEALARSEMTERHSVRDLFGRITPLRAGSGVCVVTPGPAGGGIAGRQEPGTVIVDVSEPGFDGIFSYQH